LYFRGVAPDRVDDIKITLRRSTGNRIS